MSLTNPNTVVTEERLNDFYKGIFPFLGGMPDILANKFSRADLYSTDEKMIGKWIDGKPIYQKTYDNLSIAVTKGTWTTIATLSNVENFIGCVCYFGAVGDRSVLGLSGAQIIDGTSFRIDPTDNRTVTVATIQYTKTTDSAVEIGVDTDYSTEEKIIGTWIDGKPIYQKTIVLEDTGDTTTKSVSFTELSIDTILYTTAWKVCDGYTILIPYTESVYGGGAHYIQISKPTLTGLQFVKDAAIIWVGTYYLTLQYTKTI